VFAQRAELTLVIGTNVAAIESRRAQIMRPNVSSHTCWPNIIERPIAFLSAIEEQCTGSGTLSLSPPSRSLPAFPKLPAPRE
jgi:hypothetical protein